MNFMFDVMCFLANTLVAGKTYIFLEAYNAKPSYLNEDVARVKQ